MTATHEERKLTSKQEAFIDAYLGPAHFNATEAARIAGYKGNLNTLKSIGAENLTKPDIAKAIAGVRREVRKTSIAIQEERIDGYVRRAHLLEQIRSERAESREYAHAPGGRTGFLVKSKKQIGGGENALFVDEFSVDVGLLREMRELEKQTAQDAGQWTTSTNVNITIAMREKAEQLAAQLGVPVDDVLSEAEAIASGSWNSWSPQP